MTARRTGVHSVFQSPFDHVVNLSGCFTGLQNNWECAHLILFLQAGVAEVVAAGRGQRFYQDALAECTGEFPQRPHVL